MTITSKIVYDDSSSGYFSYKKNIEAVLSAAIADWGSKFVGDTSLKVLVKFESSSKTGLLAQAGAMSLVTLYKEGSKEYGITNTSYKINTGYDTNGDDADLQIVFNTKAINGFDWSGKAVSGKHDAYTVIKHEIGHSLGFTGRLNDVTGVAPTGKALSGFDKFVSLDKDGNPSFNGPNAVVVNSGAVGLAKGSLNHVGASQDLMSATLTTGVSKDISSLDIAILSDVGLTTAYSDRVYGARYNDSINSGSGDDTVYGAGGNDVINGAEGNDLLYGNDGFDLMYGGFGDDTVYGGTGGDTLYGGQGNDYVAGGNGTDYILGGLGSDTLVGGLDADYFMFASGWGKDTVTDFNGAGGDRVVLNSGLSYTLKSAVNGDAVISISSTDEVRLSNVSLKNFQSSWIIIA